MSKIKTYISIEYLIEFLIILQTMRLIEIKVSRSDLSNWLVRRAADINKDIETGKAAR